MKMTKMTVAPSWILPGDRLPGFVNAAGNGETTMIATSIAVPLSRSGDWLRVEAYDPARQTPAAEPIMFRSTDRAKIERPTVYGPWEARAAAVYGADTIRVGLPWRSECSVWDDLYYGEDDDGPTCNWPIATGDTDEEAAEQFCEEVAS